MPNWCKGDLKVRGTKEQLKRFLIEGLVPCTFMGTTEAEPIIEENDYEFIMRVEKPHTCFYLKNTRRQFIEQNQVEFYFPDEDEKTVLVLELEGAWSIDVHGLVGLSKEFGVDFKILGFERGMEFNQDVEITNGEVVKNEEIQFENYEWECIRPHIGG